MKNRLNVLSSFIATLATICSCGSIKDFSYLQDAGNFESMPINDTAETRAHKGDVIYIYVSSRNPESSKPFNLTAAGQTYDNNNYSSYSTMHSLGYQVDELGDIEFPQLGVIHCEGMTRRELSDYIKWQLIDNDFLKDPIVTIEFQNLKVTVLGEVSHPGSYAMNNNHTTLIEALGMAGDLTPYGRRDKVAVIREVDGKRTIVYHDLRSKDMFNSPRYYLQQNDIVYVEPNKFKSSQGNVSVWNQPSVWISGFSTLISLATFIKLLAR